MYMYIDFESETPCLSISNYTISQANCRKLKSFWTDWYNLGSIYNINNQTSNEQHQYTKSNIQHQTCNKINNQINKKCYQFFPDL